MPQYRLHLIDDEGEIAERVEFHAHDDQHALEIARRRNDTAVTELWCGKDWVAIIPVVARPIVRGEIEPEE